ncbi:endonuclease/exonuclease/phosphatase family protein [Butyrivibrio sp. MC2013]|uniref:endonuclease/exonuclease/phosphatase family protein n=1 Tax=Butyrivibrio sp. MC2013 TaxID=1280686 RepID=UPI00042531E2|nr:endonuclease/exonuclease/phosphatase family protein [Butyrivibrio sp. MC2013]
MNKNTNTPSSSKGKKSPLKLPCKILAIILVLVFVFLLVYTLAEYRPKDFEELEISGSAAPYPADKNTLSVLSWNIGYGGLSANEDFFLDGGKNTGPESKEEVENNLEKIGAFIKESAADVCYLQETDKNSSRSFHIDETQKISAVVDGAESVYSPNYKCFYVPVPLPPIGKVDAGLFTLSSYHIDNAERIALPCPFSWPLRTVNLKRCIEVNRVPIEDSDKEWVLVNIHLEAYDSGEGKIAQTKVLSDFLKAEYKKGNYIVAAGDFNQSFSNIDTSAYPLTDESLWLCGQLDAESFGEHFNLVMDNSTPTCRSLDKPYPGGSPSDFQYYMLDGFIVSDNLQIDKYETIDLDFENSDHNPVYIEVTIK